MLGSHSTTKEESEALDLVYLTHTRKGKQETKKQ